MSDSETSVAHTLLNDPGVQQAKQLIADLKAKGFEVFYSPSSLMIVGEIKSDAMPPPGAMDELFPLHHEIGLLFALRAFSNHYQSLSVANKYISAIQHGHQLNANKNQA